MAALMMAACLGVRQMDNRELASFLVLGALVLLVLINRSTRSSALAVLSALSGKLLFVYGFFAVWVCAFVALAHTVGLWSSKVWAATALWFLFAGTALLFNFNEVSKDRAFFRRRILEVVGIGAAFEFFVNVQAFQLWIEILLQLVILFLVIIDTYAWSKPEYRPAGMVTRTVLVIIFLSIALITLLAVIERWRNLYWEELLQELLLPIWLTAAAIPLVFVIALVAAYESQFVRLTWHNGENPLPLRVKLAVVLGLGASPTSVAGLRAPYIQAVARAKTFPEALSEIQKMAAGNET